MGRNKDQKARRKNAPGIARNLAREAAVVNDDDAGGPEPDAKDRGAYPDVECPKCFAEPGEACITVSGNQASKIHAARLK